MKMIALGDGDGSPGTSPEPESNPHAEPPHEFEPPWGPGNPPMDAEFLTPGGTLGSSGAGASGSRAAGVSKGAVAEAGRFGDVPNGIGGGGGGLLRGGSPGMSEENAGSGGLAAAADGWGGGPSGSAGGGCRSWGSSGGGGERGPKRARLGAAPQLPSDAPGGGGSGGDGSSGGVRSTSRSAAAPASADICSLGDEDSDSEEIMSPEVPAPPSADPRIPGRSQDPLEAETQSRGHGIPLDVPKHHPPTPHRPVTAPPPPPTWKEAPGPSISPRAAGGAVGAIRGAERTAPAMPVPAPLERIRCVPVGRALPNVTVFVARFANAPDTDGEAAKARGALRLPGGREIQLMAPGEIGEVCVAGAGLAYGYLR